MKTAAIDTTRASMRSGKPCASRQRLRTSLLLCALLAPASALACWEQAAAAYGVSPYLLYAIARTESGLNPSAFHRNRDGSFDIGLMQINSRWLPALRKHGITEAQLYDPCVSIHVGAWILAGNMRRLGNTWEAVGAYNAKSPELRIRYAHKVYKNLPPSLTREQADGQLP